MRHFIYVLISNGTLCCFQPKWAPFTDFKWYVWHSASFLNHRVLSKTSRPENGMSHLPIKMMVVLGKCNYVSCTLHLKERYGLILEFVLKRRPRQVRYALDFGVMSTFVYFTENRHIFITWTANLCRALLKYIWTVSIRARPVH